MANRKLVKRIKDLKKSTNQQQLQIKTMTKKLVHKRRQFKNAIARDEYNLKQKNKYFEIVQHLQNEMSNLEESNIQLQSQITNLEHDNSNLITNEQYLQLLINDDNIIKTFNEHKYTFTPELQVLVYKLLEFHVSP